MDTKVTQKLVTTRSTTPRIEVTKGKRWHYQNLPGRCLMWLGHTLCLGSTPGGMWQPPLDHRKVTLGLVLSATAGGMPHRSWTSWSISLLSSCWPVSCCGLPGAQGSSREPGGKGAWEVWLAQSQHQHRRAEAVAFFASLPLLLFLCWSLLSVLFTDIYSKLSNKGISYL